MNENNQEVVTKKKSNKVLIVVIILQLIIIVGMGLYILNDTGLVKIYNTKKDTEEKSNTKKTDKVKDEQKSTSNTASTAVKQLDITKCLNSTNSFSNPRENADDLGLTVTPAGNTAKLTIDWSKFGKYSGASAYVDEAKDYTISNFQGNIKSAFVGEMGQDAKGTTLFFLMDDGRVEYMPMFVLKYDSQGTGYYVMNYTDDYSADNRIIGSHFESKGKVKGVTGAIKFYLADGNGYVNTIAATEEGTYYDLGTAIRG